MKTYQVTEDLLNEIVLIVQELPAKHVHGTLNKILALKNQNDYIGKKLGSEKDEKKPSEKKA